MRMFRRVPKLPSDLRPPVEPGERILAWALSAEGGAVVVTNRGLWLPGRDERVGFHAIHKVAWSGSSLEVTPARIVAERDAYTVVADLPVEAYALPDPDDVPEQVRARVTRSVGYTTHHWLAGTSAASTGSPGRSVTTRARTGRRPRSWRRPPS
jgi:hypothetical protein